MKTKKYKKRNQYAGFLMKSFEFEYKIK